MPLLPSFYSTEAVLVLLSTKSLLLYTQVSTLSEACIRNCWCGESPEGIMAFCESVKYAVLIRLSGGTASAKKLNKIIWIGWDASVLTMLYAANIICLLSCSTLGSAVWIPGAEVMKCTRCWVCCFRTYRWAILIWIGDFLAWFVVVLMPMCVDYCSVLDSCYKCADKIITEWEFQGTTLRSDGNMPLMN